MKTVAEDILYYTAHPEAATPPPEPLPPDEAPLFVKIVLVVGLGLILTSIFRR